MSGLNYTGIFIYTVSVVFNTKQHRDSTFQGRTISTHSKTSPAANFYIHISLVVKLSWAVAFVIKVFHFSHKMFPTFLAFY